MYLKGKVLKLQEENQSWKKEKLDLLTQLETLISQLVIEKQSNENPFTEPITKNEKHMNKETVTEDLVDEPSIVDKKTTNDSLIEKITQAMSQVTLKEKEIKELKNKIKG